MADVDFGLVPFNKNCNHFPASVVGYTLLGTKVVEYASYNVISLVNRNCGGSVAIANKYEVGISYSDYDLGSLGTLLDSTKSLKLDFQGLNNVTSIDSIVSSYLNIYKCLVQY